MSTKPATTPTPEFSEADKAWIDRNPRWRGVLMVFRYALTPLLIASMTAYFQLRSQHTEKKADVAYQTVAPAVNATQDEIKALRQQVDLLQRLVLAQSRLNTVTALPAGAGYGTGRPVLRPLPPVSTPAKEKLVEQLEQAPKRSFAPQALPQSITP